MLTFKSQLPGKDAIGVSRIAPIYFEIWENQTVLDVTSVNVSISSEDAIVNGIFQTNYSGSILATNYGHAIYISHSQNWVRGATITVNITVTDTVGNNYTNDYSFSVVTLDTEKPTLLANPKGGLFASNQNVNLLSNKPNTTIYYTLDGSFPTNTSSQYNGQINISENSVLKFLGVDEDNNQSDVYVEVYEFEFATSDHVAPVTVSNVPNGTYHSIMSINLMSNESTTIYWTINGNNPTVNSYHGKDSSPVTIPLKLGKNEIRFFAVDLNGNKENVKSASYIIQPKENNIVPKNVFVTSPYIRNVLDISWDNVYPQDLEVTGYNVYRSQKQTKFLKNVLSHDIISADQNYTTKEGDFVKINSQLIMTNFYRDSWLDRTVIEEDVSEQFRFKTEINASTNFDGASVNDKQWQAFDPHRLFNQFDGLHFVDVYGNSRESEVMSVFRVNGDFDIQTKFTLVQWPITQPLFSSEIAFKIHLNDFTFVSIARIRKESTDYYQTKLVVDSVIISEQLITTTDIQGKFRISRFGSDVTTFYYDGANWIIADSYLSFSKSDLQVKYYARSSDQVLKVDFSDFTQTSGKSLLPLINDSLGQYCFKTSHKPIATVKNRNYNLYSDDVNSIKVNVDGKVALVKEVDGIKGEIVLNTERQYDYILNRWIDPVIPTSQSIVTVTYPYIVSSFKLNLASSPSYKVTCVLSDGSETILDICEPTSLEADKVDYMYQEAMRRNSWLLDQVGERVLLFKRKTVGEKCKCYEKDERTHKQPKVGPCKICYGTGFVGGYDGPYEIKISPAQTEQKIAMTDRGMKLENTENTWTGMSPIIDQRDFVLRKTFEVYAIGPVARPEVRGTPTQQHFQIEFVDTTDIRYEFIQSLDLFGYSKRIGLEQPKVHFTENNNSGIKNGELTEDDRLRTNKGIEFDKPKGRTITFENTTF